MVIVSNVNVNDGGYDNGKSKGDGIDDIEVEARMKRAEKEQAECFLPHSSYSLQCILCSIHKI